jgi:hypothetical protein
VRTTAALIILVMALPRAAGAVPGPDTNDLAHDLRAAFGEDVWVCRGDACGLALDAVTCATDAVGTSCRASDRAHRSREVRATGAAARELSEQLEADTGRPSAFAISCVPWEANVHCSIEAEPGDRAMFAAVEPFTAHKLGRTDYTEQPIGVTCDGGCRLATGDQHRSITGSQAITLAQVLAKRLGVRCASATRCKIAGLVSCRSSGTADGGLSVVVTCSVAAP